MDQRITETQARLPYQVIIEVWALPVQNTTVGFARHRIEIPWITAKLWAFCLPRLMFLRHVIFSEFKFALQYWTILSSKILKTLQLTLKFGTSFLLLPLYPCNLWPGVYYIHCRGMKIWLCIPQLVSWPCFLSDNYVKKCNFNMGWHSLQYYLWITSCIARSE